MHVYRSVTKAQVAVQGAVCLGRRCKRTEADEVAFLVARELRAVVHKRRECPFFVFGLRDERPVRAYEKHPSACVDFDKERDTDKGSVVVYAHAENLRARLFIVTAPFPRLQETMRLKAREKPLPDRLVPYRLHVVGIAALGREPLVDVGCD